MFRGTHLFFTLLFIISSSVFVQGSTPCNRSCGVKSVPFPFGFDGSCEIKLQCNQTSGIFTIGDFSIRNITSESLLIELPANCNRSMKKLKDLFGRNYAPSWKTKFLFHNCTNPQLNCSTPLLLPADQNKFQTCANNISCYSIKNQSGVMNKMDIDSKNCQSLISSVVNVEQNTETFLGQMIELQWWMTKEISCSGKADVVTVNRSNTQIGYRCNCIEGYEGDGFTAGKGCRRVPCNSSKHIFGHCGRTKRIVILGIGIAVGATLMVILCFLFHFVRRHSASLKSKKSTQRLLLEAASSVPLYPYREIERATNSFSEKQRLGTGAYGTVYAGKLHNDEWVAIKKIKHRDMDGIDQVMNEIKLLSAVRHPNLVRLLGCCIEKGEQILVYEFMPNGTLSQHLQRERGSGLPWSVRLTIATETAQAIAHLHSSMNPPIYHRDIKSSNILLDYNFKSKVADFGLSRLGMIETSHISTAPQGTPGYLDPQYHQNFHLSDKSDVYSFGVVLVEIITALKVVDFSRNSNEVNLASLAIDKIGKGKIDEILDPYLEPHRDAWTLHSIYKVAELAFRCLAFHRDMRPSMTEIANELEQIRISAWTQLEETIYGSTTSSISSISIIPSERSSKRFKKFGVKERVLLLPQKTDCVISENPSDNLPATVQYSWISEQSSSSKSNFLNNVIE